MDSCPHLDALAEPDRAAVRPSGQGCKECLETRGWWVHLRLCMACGHVGCCDSSPSKHATRHAHKTKHPVIRSYEPGEEWAFCYPDDLMADGVPALAGEATAQHYDSPYG